MSISWKIFPYRRLASARGQTVLDDLGDPGTSTGSAGNRRAYSGAIFRFSARPTPATALTRGGREWLSDCWSDGDTEDHTIVGQPSLLTYMTLSRDSSDPDLAAPSAFSIASPRNSSILPTSRNSRRADDRDRSTYCGSERSDGDAGHKRKPIHLGR